jgi:ABC-type nitrate/sulfonate/bicarbonate transport system substrate-binding protein
MPEMRRTGFGRLARIGRRAGLASLAAAALMAGPVDGPGAVAQELKELSVSVGRQPWAAGNSPITQHMIDSELFEKQARELGYDLTIDYRDYPSAMPQVEAFVGGNLDFGMWGNTPIIRGIAQGQPWTVLNVGEGHFRFIIVVRPDSDIRNVQDLRGKTIGALFGGDPYNALSQILLGELGSGDPRELGINIVNMPSGAQAATVPQGVDAAITTSPHFLKARTEVGTVGIVNSFGYTEEHYRGPAGEGEGHLLESVKQSKFYPDGYYLHRSFWVVQDSIIEEHPDIVVAFISAQQQAVEELSAKSPEEIATIAEEYWKLPPELGAEVAEDELLFIRDWVWPTEGDASALLEISRFMVAGGLIEEPLEWDQVKNAFRKGADLQKRAWEQSGQVPPMEAFQATDTQDIRGLPVWEMEQ